MDEIKSKSQKKREADALQKIGVKLIELSEDKLELLPLSEPLRNAIFEAKKIKSHGATRRQAQLIGKLMRRDDSDAIIQAYESLLLKEKAQTASFHEVEQWRDKLIIGDKEALTAFINLYQPEDVQQLRQLIKKAIEDHQKQQNRGAAKALFRYLRACLENDI